jgi:glutathione synthase/RimK-type ligase-like ATP-grasp enzyme
MQDTILILSHPDDTTAQRVVHALHDASARVLFLDTGAFPSRIRLHAQFVDGQWRGSFLAEGASYALEQIKSVLVRRPTHYQVDQEAPELIQAFLENEAVKGFGGILRTLPCLWMNPLDAHRAANFKPRQIHVAAQVGLRVPRSLITNDPSAVLPFFEMCQGHMIYKPLHGGNVAGGGNVAHTIFTSLVTRESLQHLGRVQLTAHYFQEYIDKQVELRVTVIGETTLTVAIHSQDQTQTRVDWRAGYGNLRYSTYALPERVEQQCLQLTHQLGLMYGAIDLIVTPQQEYVFLEINPGGQYEWLEAETQLPFSATIAETLIRGKEGLVW